MTAFAPISGFPGGQFDAEADVSVYTTDKDAQNYTKMTLSSTATEVPCRLVPASTSQRLAFFREVDSSAFMLHLALKKPNGGADLTITNQCHFAVNGVNYKAVGRGLRYATHQEVPVTEAVS